MKAEAVGGTTGVEPVGVAVRRWLPAWGLAAVSVAVAVALYAVAASRGFPAPGPGDAAPGTAVAAGGGPAAAPGSDRGEDRYTALAVTLLERLAAGDPAPLAGLADREELEVYVEGTPVGPEGPTQTPADLARWLQGAGAALAGPPYALPGWEGYRNVVLPLELRVPPGRAYLWIQFDGEGLVTKAYVTWEPPEQDLP